MFNSYTAPTAYVPTVWDWVVLAGLELQCGIFLVLVTFWLPISDWLIRPRLRKEQEWKRKHARQSDRALPKIERQADRVGTDGANTNTMDIDPEELRKLLNQTFAE